MARLIDPKTGTAVHVEGNLERRYRALGWSEKITKRSNKVASNPVVNPAEAETGANAAEAEAGQDSTEAEAGETLAAGEAEENQADQAEAAPAEEANEAPATRRNTRRTK